MARPGVTYHEVAIVAQQLIAAGKNPTIDAIRIALRTGSNSTLGAHLRTFKERQNQTQQIATKENIPEELIATIKGLWERVMDQADDQIQVISVQAQQEVTQLSQELQSLQKINVDHQKQLQAIKQERGSLFHEKTTLEQLLANIKVESVKATEKIASLQQHIQEKQERLDELQRLNKQVQLNLEHYRTSVLEQRHQDQQRFEQQQKSLEQTILNLNQKITKISSDNILLQKQEQKIIFENETLKSTISKLTIEHEKITLRFAESQNELSRKQHDLEMLHALQIKYKEENKLMIELQTQNALTLQQLEAEKVKCKELADQNKALASEKWLLGQEKAQLYGQLKQLDHAFKNKLSSINTN